MPALILLRGEVMRWLFLGLVIVNLFYFIWSLGSKPQSAAVNKPAQLEYLSFLSIKSDLEHQLYA